jgi:signal transduction histidine kinase
VKAKANLFVKIFLGFWLVSALILASWLLATRYFDALPDRRPGPGPEGAPRQFMLRLVYELQNTSDEKLPQILRDTKQKHNIDIFLLTREGVDIYARQLIPGVAKIAMQLDRRNRRRFLDTPQGFMQAHFIHRDTQGPLRAVMVFKHKRPGLVSLLNKNVGLRLALAIIVSGLLCYTLSRALTRRIKTLQHAARQLAQGDLATRITVRDQGGDETDELARDLNSMAAQLDNKIQAQKRLLSDVSHELRSPLARLHVALALAQRDIQNNDQHLQRIDLEAQRLEVLIKQLLSMQSETHVSDTFVDLVKLLRDTCHDAGFEGEPQGKKVIFSTGLKQAVLPSYGDSLKSCFENILRNAVKYTADSTSIQASLTRDDTSYVIRVEDCGPGVKEEELEKLFDEFYRSDDARRRETGGHGLGLSISKRAVAQHAGVIQALNTDKGLAIVVGLPLQQKE